MAHSLYIYNAAGELDTIVFGAEKPDAEHWQKLVPGGVVLKIDPAVYAGQVDPHPVNFNGKPVWHDLDKLLLPEVQKLSQAHADAVQAKIDHRETVWAAEAQARVDEKAKMAAFVASLDVSEKQRFDTIATRQDAIDFYNSLPLEKQSKSPITPPKAEAAVDAEVAPP